MQDPTAERTVTLADAIGNVAEEYDRLESRLEDAEDAEQAAGQYGLNELEQMGNALGELAEEHGPDATLTYRGLRAGEFGLVEDRVDRKREQDGGSARRGYHRIVYAAAGLVDAPFFDAGDVTHPPYGERTMEGQLEARMSAVASQNIGLVKWLYAKVDDRTTADAGNWRRFADSTRDAPEPSNPTTSSDMRSQSANSTD